MIYPSALTMDSVCSSSLVAAPWPPTIVVIHRSVSILSRIIGVHRALYLCAARRSVRSWA